MLVGLTKVNHFKSRHTGKSEIRLTHFNQKVRGWGLDVPASPARNNSPTGILMEPETIAYQDHETRKTLYVLELVDSRVSQPQGRQNYLQGMGGWKKRMTLCNASTLR